MLFIFIAFQFEQSSHYQLESVLHNKYATLCDSTTTKKKKPAAATDDHYLLDWKKQANTLIYTVFMVHLYRGP